MADISYQQDSRSSLPTGLSWSAIWAGLFTFIAIWSVFALLGFAIFSRNVNNGAVEPVHMLNVGMGIWTIILSAVAMYIAGRATGRLAGASGRYDSVVHGMVMFGLSVTAAIVLAISGRTLLISFPAGNLTVPYRSGVFGGSEWLAFVALFVGWLFAILGSVSGAMMRKPAAPSNVRDMRPAA